MLRLLAALVLLLGLSFASATGAQVPRRPALHWARGAGAESCVDPRTLALQVVALTGPVLVDASEAELSIEGHITRIAPQQFEARIGAVGRDGAVRGARTLQHAGDCRALDRALAFVIALLIDPDLALERLPGSVVVLGAEGAGPEHELLRELNEKPPVPHVLPPPPAPARPEPPQPKPRTAARSPLSLQFGFSLGLRELPRPSLAIVTALHGAPHRYFALELGVRTSFMLGAYDIGTRSVDAYSQSANLLACPRYPWESVVLELCGGAEAILLRARGNGFTTNKAAFRLAAGALVALGVSARVHGDWSLQLRALTRILFDKPSFTYEQPDGVKQAFALHRGAFALNLGAVYHF
jgi:hypothetical protein